jgi:hypothetical protein
MSNLEELHLDITIKNRTAFIDGTHIDNEILVYMPRLHIFNFCICTKTKMDLLVHDLLSKDDIQRSFTNIMYQQMDCIVNYPHPSAICNVFSLPFVFENLRFIGSTFPSIISSHVRRLSVHDDVPLKHEFFIRIAWSFPLLKELCVININPQSSISDERNSNGNELYSIVKLNYLNSLHLADVHIDYVEQFLNETNTHMPYLTELIVNYDHLTIVTENFTRYTTRRNCFQVKKLNIGETRTHYSRDFYSYFPLLDRFFSFSLN